ncbi:MAG: hypothetical protein AAF604_02905 [Acidobacteriota bacterium]
MNLRRAFWSTLFLPATLFAAEPDALVVAPGDQIRLQHSQPGLAVEAAIDGGLLAEAEDALVTAPAEEGLHWLTSASRDAAGNRSALRWTRLRVDATPPEVTLTVEPEVVEDTAGQRWTSPTAAVVARGRDDYAGVARVEVDGGGGKVTAAGDQARGSIAGAGGTVILQGWATDGVGNRSEAERLELRLDATPPSAKIYVEGPWARLGEVLFLGPGSRLAPRGSDSESGFGEFRDYRLDGAAVRADRWSPPWTAGPHRATVTAADRVGNSTTTETLEFSIDLEPPAIVWNLVDVDEINQLHIVAARAEDAGAGLQRLEWSEDGATWRPADEPFATVGHRITLRATDRVGNQASEVADIAATVAAINAGGAP